jgi:prevent-host-death family protein
MARPTVNIYEAKTRLSQLVDQAASGQDVIIGRGGKPVALLTRLETPKRTVQFGLLRGKVKVAADFDAPLPDEVAAAFEGR